MKANELIKKLNTLVQEHGDCDVVFFDGDLANEVDAIELVETQDKEHLFAVHALNESDHVVRADEGPKADANEEPTEATVAPSGSDAPETTVETEETLN